MMNSNKMVSIIVPVYKVEKYLATCVDSILHQSYINWELILVDDGSPDRCGEICDRYANIDKRIKVIHKQNAGVAAARNSGIEQASGDYATYLDGDDFFHPDCLENLVRIAVEKQADIVQCDYVRGFDTSFPSCEQEEKVRTYSNHTVFTEDVAKVIVWGKLYRIDILKDIRIPEGRYFEDDLVAWRWYYAANRIVVTSKPYYYYTINNDSTMAQHKKKPNISFIEAYDERIDFFEKCGDEDLVTCSKLQLCKCVALVYGNALLDVQQKQILRTKFYECWKSIKTSKVVPVKFVILFSLFAACPQLIGKFLQRREF